MEHLWLGVDTDIIKLIDRWQSDEMLCYLHVQARPVIKGFAQRMLLAGDYTLHLKPAVPGLAKEIPRIVDEDAFVPLY